MPDLEQWLQVQYQGLSNHNYGCGLPHENIRMSPLW